MSTDPNFTQNVLALPVVKATVLYCAYNKLKLRAGHTLKTEMIREGAREPVQPAGWKSFLL